MVTLPPAEVLPGETVALVVKPPWLNDAARPTGANRLAPATAHSVTASVMMSLSFTVGTLFLGIAVRGRQVIAAAPRTTRVVRGAATEQDRSNRRTGFLIGGK